MRIICLVMLATIVTLCSCNGGSLPADRDLNESGYATAPRADMPGLPIGNKPLRAATEAMNHTFTNLDILSGEEASFNASLLQLEETGDSWAVLGVDLGGGTPTGITLDGSADGLYVGISDYGESRWNWLGEPVTGAGLLTVPSGTYTNGSGHCYVAVYAVAGVECNASVTLDYTSEGAGDGTWNLMVWMAADNDLSMDGYNDIQQMETTTTHENINILVGYDLDPEYLDGSLGGIDEVHFIKVTPDEDATAINTEGHTANRSFDRAGYDSADPANLVEFLDWCDTNFLADNTILVLWDHGDGWKPGNGAGGGGGWKRSSPMSPGDPLSARKPSGILSDYSHGTGGLTSNAAIVSALAGRHFNGIFFDACNMGHLESLYEYTPLCDWLAASQILVPGEGYEYDDALEAWVTGYPMTTSQIGTAFVDTAQVHYYSMDEYMNHAVFGSSAIVGLVETLTGLADAVTPNGATESEHVKAAITEAFEPQDGDGTRDLKTFLTEYESLTTDETIQNSLVAALQALASAVTHYNHVNRPVPTCNGIGAFLPNVSYFDPFTKSEYRPLAFNQTTGWLEMLEATGVPENGGGGDPFDEDWDDGDKFVITWVETDADIDLVTYDMQDDIVTGPEGNIGPGYQTENLLFSQGSSESGLTEEWAQLKPDADVGDYGMELVYFWWNGAGVAPNVEVSVQLFRSDGSLKKDLGTATLAVDDANAFATMIKL